MSPSVWHKRILQHNPKCNAVQHSNQQYICRPPRHFHGHLAWPGHGVERQRTRGTSSKSREWLGVSEALGLESSFALDQVDDEDDDSNHEQEVD